MKKISNIARLSIPEMKVAIIFNRDLSGVINVFGMQNKEVYNPRTVKRVTDALESGGHNVGVIDGNMKVIEQLQQFMPKVIEGEQLGMVFNMAYGIQGESRYTHIPSMLEMLGIPYVGSSPAGHAIALDKVITKIILQKHGISTPDFWVFSGPGEDFSPVRYPAIVKPKMESVSFGLRVVHNEKELKEAVEYIISEFQQQALVEQFIRGREFAVGLLGNNPVETFPVLEFDLENDPDAIQTAGHKRKNPMEKICPAAIPENLSDEMRRQSRAAFKALQLRDFARVDIRMDAEDHMYILEINSMASLGMTGSYVHAARVGGYDYGALVNKIFDVAAVRYFASRMSDLAQSSAGRTTPPQTRIRGFLRSRREQIEKLLRDSVNMNTHVRNVEGVNEFGNLVREELVPLGFSQEVIPQVEVGNLLFFTNAPEGDYDILFLGALDNRRKISEHSYFRETDQKLSGTGIWEHKGGIIACIAALQSLRFIRALRKINIGLLFTSDDSLQGKFASEHVKLKARNAAYVIGLHGGDLSGSLVTSRSGSAFYRCHMHLQKTDDSGMVAIAASVFSRLINSWCELSVDDHTLVIAPYRSTLNTNIMQPYAHGEVLLSARYNRPDQFKEVDRRIRKLIPSRKYRGSIHFQIDGGLNRGPFTETEQVLEFWKRVKDLAGRLDIRITREHRWSSADICFVEGERHILDGFGPIGQRDPDGLEYILRHSVLERALLLAMTLKEISGR
jgi:D-alanine-D-alanine ligase